MKIVDAKVIVCSPGRNFVTLKITTEDGIHGIGAGATLNGRELAVVAYLEEHVIPLLIGRDARRIEDTWQFLYKGAYLAARARDDDGHQRRRASPLWDFKGKALGVPVYQLLGGRSRDDVIVYGHANGTDIDDTVEAVKKYVGLGYKAVRVQSGIPGLKGVYGIGRGTMSYEPAERGKIPEFEWSSEKYLNFAPKLFAAVRKEVGPDVHLLHDVHHRLTPIEAARLGKELEPHHLFWMEDAVAAPSCRTACASCASTLRRRWQSARSSTRSTTARRCCATSSSTTSARPSCTPAGCRTCARSRTWPSCIRVKTGAHGATGT